MQSCSVRWASAAIFLLMLGCSDPQGDSPSLRPDTSEPGIGKPEISEGQQAGEAVAEKTVQEPASALEWAGVTVTEVELKAEPSMESAMLALLATGTHVTVRERRGGWYRVAVANGSGWLRILAVARDGGQVAASGMRELETAADMATGRSGPGNVVITTGIRGFDAQELATAEPDWEELARLEGFVQTPTEAAAAARAAGLKARKVQYLQRPKR